MAEDGSEEIMFICKYQEKDLTLTVCDLSTQSAWN